MESHKPPIDPRLDAAIEQAGEHGEVEAMVVISGAARVPADERGLGGQIVDRLADRLHEKPTKVRYMPRLRTLYVMASGRLVRALLNEKEVVSASAVAGGN